MPYSPHKQAAIEALRQQAGPAFARYPFIEAVYLFGSHAAETALADSDVDLAVVAPKTAFAAQQLEILADLTAVGLNRIDLICLDQADHVLSFEAVHANCLLYARPDFDHAGYFTRILWEYFDFEPYLRIQRAAYKQRVLSGQA